MDFINTLLVLAGGATLFMLGQRLFAEGVQRLSGKALRSLSGKLGGSRITTAAAAIGLSAGIQSSAAAGAMVNGLLTVGALSSLQAATALLGAHVGVTATPWLVTLAAFPIESALIGALSILTLSLPFILSAQSNRRAFGDSLAGFSLMMLAVHLLRNWVPSTDLVRAAWLLPGLYEFNIGYFLAYAGAGVVLGAVFRSTSPLVVTLAVLGFRGWLTFPAICAIIAGLNLGPALSAILRFSSIDLHTKRLNSISLAVRLLGMVWITFFFDLSTNAITSLFGHIATLENTPLQAVFFHTMFNLVNAILLYPLIPVLVRLSEKLLPDRAANPDQMLTPIGGAFPDFANVNLDLARRETARLSSRVHDMLLLFMNRMEEDEVMLEQAKREEAECAELQTNLGRFLADLRPRLYRDNQSGILNGLVTIAGDLRNSAAIVLSLHELLDLRKKKKLRFHKHATQDLQDFSAQVLDFMTMNSTSLLENNPAGDWEAASKMEAAIESRRKNLRKLTGAKLSAGADIQAELLFLEMVTLFAHLGDLNLSIARSLKTMQENA